ncbi:MAG TPA: hypothetical protein VF282_08315 [Bacillota bacterium]
MPRSRREMEQALAESFGYADYAAFRQGVADTLGKGVLRRLEKQLDEMTEDDRGTGDDPSSSGNAQRASGPRAGKPKSRGGSGAGAEEGSTGRG